MNATHAAFPNQSLKKLKQQVQKYELKIKLDLATT